MEGQPEPCVLFNATRLVDCIDDAASEHVERWVPEDIKEALERTSATGMTFTEV